MFKYKVFCFYLNRYEKIQTPTVECHPQEVSTPAKNSSFMDVHVSWQGKHWKWMFM